MKISLIVAVIMLIYPISAQLIDKSVEKQIYYPCGCGEVLADCHCETAMEVKGEIQRKILSGSKPEEILSDYVRIYGASILVTGETLSKSKSDETLFLYLIGIGVTATIAYVLGGSSRKVKDWELKKR